MNKKGGSVDGRHSVSRREFVKVSTIAVGAGLTAASGLDVLGATDKPAAASREVVLNLLEGTAESSDTGVSFGVPWSQGAVKHSDTFILSSQGKRLPVQSWPLAFWPDGSEPGARTPAAAAGDFASAASGSPASSSPHTKGHALSSDWTHSNRANAGASPSLRSAGNDARSGPRPASFGRPSPVAG